MLYAADSVCICVAGAYSFGNLFSYFIVLHKKGADTSFILGIRSAPFTFSFILLSVLSAHHFYPQLRLRTDGKATSRIACAAFYFWKHTEEQCSYRRALLHITKQLSLNAVLSKNIVFYFIIGLP